MSRHPRHPDQKTVKTQTRAAGRKPRRLAIDGAMPAFREPIHVGRPNVGSREDLRQRMDAILDRRWLTNDGPMVREFERRIAEYVGVKHCLAMCNATVALEIAVRALGLRGEVIIPSFTFVATAHALQWQEITPVFADIDPRTHCIDPAAVERMITPRTSGIIGVHLWGHTCDVDGLAALADRRGIELIFDAAHAFGCSHRGRMIGGLGRAEVFSFHATKFVNSGEGGAVVTNDDTLADKIRLMRNFGFSGYDNVIYVGTNGKMSELSGALGLTNFASLPEFVAVNRRNHDLYRQHLAGVPGLSLTPYDETEACNYQYVVVQVDEDACGVSRDALLHALHAENVLARRYFHPGCHRMEPYRSLFPHAGLLLPVTNTVCRQVLVLPTGTAVAPDDIATICAIMRECVHVSERTMKASASNPGRTG